MFFLLKRLYWDLQDQHIRFHYYNAVLMHLPGFAGIAFRARILPRFFEEHGENIQILDGTKFKGVNKLKVGSNVIIGNDNFIQASGGVTLCDNVMLGPGVKVWSVNHKYDDPDVPIIDQGYHLGPIFIGAGSWLGANVFIMPGVTIPEGCIVSAGSIVHKRSYPPYSIIAGNPCRVIGNRRQSASTGS